MKLLFKLYATFWIISHLAVVGLLAYGMETIAKIVMLQDLVLMCVALLFMSGYAIKSVWTERL